jgi:hypothetical protein
LSDLVQLPSASIWMVSRMPAIPPVFSMVIATADIAGDDGVALDEPGPPVVEAQPDRTSKSNKAYRTMNTTL